MADSKQNRCPRCGAPKTTEATGSLTQWIAVCRCDMKPLAPVEQAETMHFCGTCGKRINPGRAGSLTQWILRGDICNCQNPVPTVFGQGRIGSAAAQSGYGNSSAGVSINNQSRAFGTAQAIDFVEEPELEVSPETFPRDRYKALELLGEGGSGRVYRCFDRLLENQVAIKLLLSLSSEQVISFQKEARAGSVLQHEGLVSVRDFGVTASGAPYMVMDFVPGVSLDRYIEHEGALTEDEAIEVFSKVADALAYAHQKNIFHRDMKTSNIIVSVGQNNETVANVIDFGVSSFSQEKTMMSGNTLTGTPAYMPPDQASGLQFDARSEVYALGCVIFEALTGEVPFSGDTALATIGMHANKPAPRLSDAVVGKEFSEKMERVIARCLEKNPADRFHSMQALREALLRVRDEALTQSEDSSISLFSMPEQAGQFESSKASGDRKFIAICLSVVAIVVGSVLGFNSLVNAIASKSPDAEMKIKSSMDDFDATEFTASVKKHIDDKVINDTERVQWKSTGVVKVRDGIDQDLEELATQKTQPLTVMNIVGGKFSDNALRGLSRVPLTVLFVTDVDFSTIGQLKLDHLKVANFTTCKFPEDNPFGLLNESPLRALYIHDSRITNKAFESLKRHKEMTYLALHGCEGFTDGWQNGLTLTNVTWLAKHFSEYPESGFNHLISLPKLKELVLSSDCMSSVQFDRISKLKLNSLLLVGEKLIADENLEKLKKLPVRDFNLGFKFSCVGLKSFRMLSGRKWKQLGFYETKLSDADLERLAVLNCDEFIFDEPSLTYAGIKNLMKKRPLKMLFLGKLCTNFSRDQMFEVQRLQPDCVIRYANEHGDLVELQKKGQVLQPLPEATTN